MTTPPPSNSHRSPMELVAEFHESQDVTVNATPTWPSQKDVALRLRLIDEEVEELREAIAAGDMVAVADALGDIAYVVYGSAVTFGIDLDAVIAEIHASNMSKLGDDGRPVHDAGGKVMKPATYRPPDLERVLAEQTRAAASQG